MRILISPPSRVYAGLPRYTSPEGEPVSADPARELPGLLSEVEIMPQPIRPGMSLTFVVGSHDPVSFRVVDAPLGVEVRRGRNRDIAEGVRDIAWVVIGVIAFVMVIASILS